MLQVAAVIQQRYPLIEKENILIIGLCFIVTFEISNRSEKSEGLLSEPMETKIKIK